MIARLSRQMFQKIGVRDIRLFLRDVALPLGAFGVVFIFPISWFVALFLILGQAHFAIAYLYQYRSGKVTPTYIFLALSLLVFFAGYFVFSNEYVPIFLVTAFFFGMHFAFDEIFLHSEKVDQPRRITALLFIILFFGMIAYTMFPELKLLALSLGLLLPSYVCVRLFISRQQPSSSERYLWLVGAIIFALTFFFAVRAEILLAVISILHQTNWYVDSGKKYADRGDVALLQKYWFEVFASIVFSAILFSLYTFAHVSVLKYLYMPMYYYAWALSHFALSVRKRTVVSS